MKPNFDMDALRSGKIVRVGADVSREDKSGASYFIVRVAIAQAGSDRLGTVKLVPGMPAEVFLKTSDRTILSYLMKPFVDQVRRAFREK